ncbi:MAG: LAGLIDADG family homing endonuclease [bacterium]|nr:LAGLIDADG family homing endonuclease [bacterium]
MDISRLRAIGRKGGLARFARYGNLGTPEGRKKGGLNSLKTHNKYNTGFLTLKKISIPKYSVQLAEFLGIIMGDGHVGKYQVSFVTNSATDLQHALFVKGLAEQLFKTQASLSYVRDKKACSVIISAKRVSAFMEKQGIPQGNKITLGIHIPEWVLKNLSYRKALARGLFDTDGCVFVDTHRYKSKEYKSLGIAFTNQSLPLLHFFNETLEILELHPTQKSKFRVFLRRREDIKRYFELIDSSNEKHLKKYRQYFSDLKKGGVA